MPATLNAIVMLTVIAATLAACITMCKQRPGWRRLLLSMGGGCGFFLAGIFLSLHMCRAGLPVRQAFVCAACFTAIWIFVTSGRARVAAAVTIFVGCIGLCEHFSALVHGPGPDYTGNPRDAESMAEVHLKTVKERVVALPDPAWHPAGWLADQEFADDALRRLVSEYHPVEPYPLWHTWLTGLFGVRRSSLDVWFPGGIPSQCADRLDWARR